MGSSKKLRQGPAWGQPRDRDEGGSKEDSQATQAIGTKYFQTGLSFF